MRKFGFSASRGTCFMGGVLLAIAALFPNRSETQTATAPSKLNSPQSLSDRMNTWSVGLAGGQLEGAPIRFAAEIARVVDDGPNMLVLPIVTRGPVENLNALLKLRGVDLAIVNSDALEEYKAQVPDIAKRVVYVLNLFPSELHIFVRPEIKSSRISRARKSISIRSEQLQLIPGPSCSVGSALMLKRLSFPIPSRSNRCAKESWLQWSLSRPNRSTHSFEDAGIPALNFCRLPTIASSKTTTYHPH